MVVHMYTGKEKIRCAKIFQTWWTLGITGGTLSKTLRNFTFRTFLNLRESVMTSFRTEVKTKEDIVTATTTAKLVFLFHRPAEALKHIDPLERIEQSQKLLESPVKILLYSTP